MNIKSNQKIIQKNKLSSLRDLETIESTRETRSALRGLNKSHLTIKTTPIMMNRLSLTFFIVMKKLTNSRTSF